MKVEWLHSEKSHVGTFEELELVLICYIFGPGLWRWEFRNQRNHLLKCGVSYSYSKAAKDGTDLLMKGKVL